MWGWAWLVNVFPGVSVGVVLGLEGAEGATDVAGDFDVDGFAGGAGYLGVLDDVLGHYQAVLSWLRATDLASALESVSVWSWAQVQVTR